MKVADLFATAARLHATGDTALVGSEVRDFAAAVLTSRLVSVDSDECELITQAMAIVDAYSEFACTGPEHAAFRERLTKTSALLKRILLDSLVQCPVAQAAYEASKEAGRG